MKVNKYVNQRARDLKKLDIPKRKMREYVKESTGFCAMVFGVDNTMESLIEESVLYGLKGQSAVDYIDRDMMALEQAQDKAFIKYLPTNML